MNRKLDRHNQLFAVFKHLFLRNISTPFLSAFMMLLLLAVALSILNLPAEAEHIANMAYFSLIIGIALHLIMHWNIRRQDDAKLPPNNNQTMEALN